MAEPPEILEGLLKAVNRGLFDLAQDVLHQYGLPASGIAVMSQILRVPGTTVSEVARRTGMAKSHVSKTVESLSEVGFLEKRPDPSDQRLVRIHATEQAEMRFREMQTAMRHRLSAVISSLPDQKVDAIIDGLKALHAALEGNNRNQP